MFTKKIIKDILEDYGIDAIVVVHVMSQKITIIIRNKTDTELVKDIMYNNCPIGVVCDIMIDLSLICEGCCFTEVDIVPPLIKTKTWLQRIINKYRGK